MRGRGIVLGWLAAAVVALACGGMSFRFADLNLRAVDEVLTVVDAADPGATVVHASSHGSDRTWLVDDATEVSMPDAVPAEAPGGPKAEACAGDACYRVPGRALRVESSVDGGRTWSTAWEVTGPAYEALVRTYPDLGDPAEHLASTSLVVHAVAGGHVVYVANGRDGLLHRDVHGVWRRLGSPDSGEGCCFYDPVPRLTSEPAPFDPAPYAAAVAVLAILVAGGIPAVRRRRPPAIGAIGAIVVLAGLCGWLAYVGAGYPGVGMFPGFVYGVPLVLLSVVGGPFLAARFARRL